MPIGTSDGKYYEDEFQQVADTPPTARITVTKQQAEMNAPSIPDWSTGFEWVDSGDLSPFDLAAERVRQAVQPIAGRNEGGFTKVLDSLGQEVVRMTTGPKRLVDAVRQQYEPGDTISTEDRLPEDILSEVGVDLATSGLGTAPFKPRGSIGTFGGLGAQTMDPTSLFKAKRMAARGEHPKDIWDETGMFQGADGKWRFEISDEGMKLKNLVESERSIKSAEDYEVALKKYTPSV